MGYGLKVIAEGPYACFTRPEMKVERVSYDVPTPGALEGMLKSVYWKPSIRYVIDQIVVFNPINFINIRRNEVKSKVLLSAVRAQMKGDETADPCVYADEDRSQRASMLLKNVRYGIAFHFEPTGIREEAEGAEKHYNILLRRLRNGQHFRQPCFGCNEFPVTRLTLTDTLDPTQVCGEIAAMEDVDLGYMLYRLRFADGGEPINGDWDDPKFSDVATAEYYRPHMRKGVIDVQKYRGGCEMLIQALCDYYDVLAKAGKVLEEGYSSVRIHYRVGLAADGRVEGIEVWQIHKIATDAKGKTKETLEPHQLALFRRTEKPGIDANIVEHRPLYLFGLNLEKDGTLHPEDRTNKAAKSRQAFVERNLAFIEGIDSPIVNAFRQFMLNWKPEQESANPCLLGLGKGYATGGFVFCLSGDPSVMLQDDPQLKARWQATLTADDGETDKVVRQCAITGEMAEIASIHDKISGVSGGLATGTKLVAFKNDSAFSYGAEQALNSNISVIAMRKYTQALNILTNGNTHKTMLGDVTMVRFAMSPDRRCDALVGNAMLGTTDDAEDEGDALDAGETEKLLQKVYAEARLGFANADRLLREQHIDPTVAYYIVGFKPNASRLAVQFLYRRQLGQLIQNVAQHQADMATGADAKPIPLWQITRQLVSPKATKQTVDPSLTAKLLEAIVYGYRYPAFLLATVVRRIQTDSDNETDKYIKFNPIRVGILKACLNRSARLNGQMEEISMALNKENSNPAYLCGRLFAVLERVQEQANPGINRTITDAYFASASTRPALIFPRLIRLAQTHLKKLEYAGYWNRLIGEINTKLNGEYPDTLDLADQGRFDIGYYQQKYAPSEKKTENTDMMEGK